MIVVPLLCGLYFGDVIDRKFIGIFIGLMCLAGGLIWLILALLFD